jgi:ferredoxin
VAWTDLKACLVCDEVCPYDAVEFIVITDYRGTQHRPIVHSEKCVGCGMCENACPVHEPRAIVVDTSGEERLREGSYITEKKRRARAVEDDRETDYMREHHVEASTDADTTAVDTSKTLPAEPLPPGFTFD